jgi:hypothetical protein
LNEEETVLVEEKKKEDREKEGEDEDEDERGKGKGELVRRRGHPLHVRKAGGKGGKETGKGKAMELAKGVCPSWTGSS